MTFYTNFEICEGNRGFFFHTIFKFLVIFVFTNYEIMAFSMLLRNSACPSRVISQQVMKLATQPFFAQRLAAASVPLKSLALDQTNSTPIINAVRSFRTTSPALAEHSHDHSKLWIIEKSVTAAMVPLIPLALMMPNKILDSILAILITAHSFWGLEAIAVDYVRAAIFGPVIPKIAIALVYLICIATLGGLFYIISHDVGVSNAVRQFWSIKAKQA